MSTVALCLSLGLVLSQGLGLVLILAFPCLDLDFGLQ